MKSGLREIVGKTISDVIVARNERGDPANQVFLVFDDGSFFEVWGAQFNCNGGVWPGGVAEPEHYVGRCGAKVVDRYPQRAAD